MDFGQKTENREEILVKQAIESGILKDHNNDFRYAVLITTIKDENGENLTTQAQVHSVDSILKKYVRYESFYWNGRIISLLIATPATFDRYLHILVGDIMQSTERIMGRNCTLGVSRMTAQLSECHDAYIEAMNAISYSGRKDSSVHYIADEEHREGIEAQEILNIVTEVEALIRGGSETELEKYLEGLFDRMYEMRLSRAKANYLMVQLFAAVCKIIYAVADGEEVEQMQKNVLLPSIIFQEGSLREMQSRLIEFCLSAGRMIGNQRKKSSKVLCEKTLHIIEMDYGNTDMSLVSVSSEIGVSPNYLSALIKKKQDRLLLTF